MSDLDDTPYYLYRIVNTVNSKCYIGVTKNPKKRKRQHLLENRKNSNPKLKASIKKYGLEVFKFEILCIGSQSYIYDLERKAIDRFDTIENGYNLSPGGRGGEGKKINKRSDDYFCFVSGFWFPNKRIACERLNITNTNTFYNKMKSGTLGETQLKVKGKSAGYPVYFKGFWFPDVDKAASVLSKTRTAVLQNLKRGTIEESSRIKTQHPIRVLSIDGRLYKTLEEASDLLQVPKATLKSRYSANWQDYTYTYIFMENKTCLQI